MLGTVKGDGDIAGNKIRALSYRTYVVVCERDNNKQVHNMRCLELHIFLSSLSFYNPVGADQPQLPQGRGLRS